MTKTEINRARRHAARDAKRAAKEKATGVVGGDGEGSDLSYEEVREREDKNDEDEYLVKKQVIIIEPLKYKTRPCMNWGRKGLCNTGYKCWFVHGEEEMRPAGQGIYEYLIEHRLREPTINYFIPKNIREKFGIEDEGYLSAAGRGRGRGRDGGRLGSPPNCHVSKLVKEQTSLMEQIKNKQTLEQRDKELAA